MSRLGTTLPSPFGAHDGGETPDSGQEPCYEGAKSYVCMICSIEPDTIVTFVS